MQNLDLFCNNKLVNNAPDQKYGQVNEFRQKVLREQYYLELLTKTLRESLTRTELDDYYEYQLYMKDLKKRKRRGNIESWSRLR